MDDTIYEINYLYIYGILFLLLMALLVNNSEILEFVFVFRSEIWVERDFE